MSDVFRESLYNCTIYIAMQRIVTRSKENMNVDDVLILMELFALPYKAVVLRLAESEAITERKAQQLLQVDAGNITVRIELTGKAEQWQQDTRRLLRYGSLLDNLAFNSKNELLRESREESDKAFLKRLSEEFCEGS